MYTQYKEETYKEPPYSREVDNIRVRWICLGISYLGSKFDGKDLKNHPMFRWNSWVVHIFLFERVGTYIVPIEVEFRKCLKAGKGSGTCGSDTISQVIFRT